MSPLVSSQFCARIDAWLSLGIDGCRWMVPTENHSMHWKRFKGVAEGRMRVIFSCRVLGFAVVVCDVCDVDSVFLVHITFISQ